jgi:hypothetical protein
MPSVAFHTFSPPAVTRTGADYNLLIFIALMPNSRQSAKYKQKIDGDPGDPFTRPAIAVRSLD